MATILLVDDSDVELRLTGGLLRHTATDCQLRYAGGGWEALQQIEEAVPDLVVTDLVMPNMDGLELVHIIRRRFPQLPVVLMTAYGNEEIARRALRAGAASYVPKANRANLLSRTVQQILGHREPVHDRERPLGHLSRLDGSFILDNDVEQIVDLIDLLLHVLRRVAGLDASAAVRVGVALEEALLNALCHGNLEINGSEYEQAKENGTLTALVEERRSQPPYRGRHIFLDAVVSGSECRFTVHDQGRGFPVSILPSGDAEFASFENGHFRGTTLMRTIMDAVEFHKPGNEVVLQSEFVHRAGHGAAMTSV